MQITAKSSNPSSLAPAIATLAVVFVALAMVTTVVASSPSSYPNAVPGGKATSASSGSSYPIEVMRAHTQYKVTDPVLTQIGLGVRGDR